MNRYVVPLNPQEQRHAVAEGLFKQFCEEVGGWTYWTENRIFSQMAQGRRRSDEFAAELAILLIEGPQDKKKSVDLYFKAYEKEFDAKDEIRTRILSYVTFISEACPNLREMQLRRPANFYALVGALDKVTDEGQNLSSGSPDRVGKLLTAFDLDIQSENPSPTGARYNRAASRQTDNIQPRQARIGVLAKLLERAW